MSGPKTSRYTLTPEQRRILEEQRRVRIERELLAKQLGDARSTIAEADRMIQQIEPLYAEIGADSAALTQAKALREAAAIALAQASSVKETDGSVRLRERNQNLRAATQKLTSTAKAAAAEYASLEMCIRDRYTSFFKIFKSSYRNDRKQIRLVFKEVRKKISDEEIIALLQSLRQYNEGMDQYQSLAAQVEQLLSLIHI